MSELTLDEANAEAVRRIRAARSSGQTWLDLGDLPIVRVPDEIVALKDTLRVLSLGKSELVEEGTAFGWESSRPGAMTDFGPVAGLTALTEFHASGCPGVSDLAPLAGLPHLAEVHFYNCRSVSDLRPLADLPALHTLHVTATAVRTLAPVAHHLPRLKWLGVRHCPLADLHPSVCVSHNCIDAARVYYAALGPDAQPDAEVKVFVLGNGRSGKTKLVGRLQGLGFDAIPEGSTHGVRIATFDVPADWGLPHPVRLCLWDFGGQDIYHGTHALFVRGPAVYLLLYSADTNNAAEIADGGFVHHNRELPYWFDYLLQEAGDGRAVTSPVLLVQGKCDARADEHRTPPFTPPADQFPDLSPLLHVSTVGRGRGLDGFREKLREAVEQLLAAHPQPPLPASWAAVREAVRGMQTAGHPRTLSLVELSALCDAHGCPPGQAEVVRDALHQMGVVFHREGAFDGRVIVDQGWALDAIYTLFRRDGKFQRKIDGQNGRFTREDLELYFWADHPPDHQRTFLGFMQQCGVCFPASRWHGRGYEGEYVFPDKLPAWGAEHEQAYRRQLADGSGEEVTAAYGPLHDGIARTFLCKIGGVAGGRAAYWRFGCHFHDGGTGCEVLIRTVGNAIRMRAWGGRAKEVLGTLLEVLAAVPCGRPPAVEWADGVAAPVVVGRAADGPPEERLAPTFGPKSVFFSYRHSHPDHPGSEKGRDLLQELKRVLGREWVVRYDESELSDGDSIAAFMDEVKACALFVPVFCGRYFDSLYTMNELFTFRQRWADRPAEFVARTVPVVFSDSGIQNPRRQAELVRRNRAVYDDLLKDAADGSLADEVYSRVKWLKGWNEQLSNLLAALSDRLHTPDPAAAAVADRLNRAAAHCTA